MINAPQRGHRRVRVDSTTGYPQQRDFPSHNCCFRTSAMRSGYRLPSSTLTSNTFFCTGSNVLRGICERPRDLISGTRKIHFTSGELDCSFFDNIYTPAYQHPKCVLRKALTYPQPSHNEAWCVSILTHGNTYTLQRHLSSCSNVHYIFGKSASCQTGA